MTMFKLWDSLGQVWYIRARYSHEAITALEKYLQEVLSSPGEKVNMWEIAYGYVNASHHVWEIHDGKLTAVDR